MAWISTTNSSRRWLHRRQLRTTPSPTRKPSNLAVKTTHAAVLLHPLQCCERCSDGHGCLANETGFFASKQFLVLARGIPSELKESTSECASQPSGISVLFLSLHVRANRGRTGRQEPPGQRRAGKDQGHQDHTHDRHSGCRRL